MVPGGPDIGDLLEVLRSRRTHRGIEDALESAFEVRCRHRRAGAEAEPLPDRERVLLPFRETAG